MHRQPDCLCRDALRGSAPRPLRRRLVRLGVRLHGLSLLLLMSAAFIVRCASGRKICAGLLAVVATGCCFGCALETEDLPAGCCELRTECCGDELEPNHVADLVDFGELPLGVELPRPLQIRNVGAQPVAISRLVKEGLWSNPDYVFGIDERVFILQPGQVENVRLTFVAHQEMPIAATATLMIEGTDIESGLVMGTRSVTLKGRGSVSHVFECTPNPLDFGVVAIGSSRTLAVVFTNHLPNAVDVTVDHDRDGNALIPSSGRGRFDLMGPVGSTGSILPQGQDDAPRLLGRNESIAVQVRYTPNDDVGDSAQWTVSLCGSPLCGHIVGLIGRGMP